MTNKIVRSVLDVIWYLVMYFIIQMVVTYVVSAADLFISTKELGMSLKGAMTHLQNMSIVCLLLAISLSSIITIIIFMWRRWSPFSREYLSTKPWAAMIWVMLLTLGTLIPSVWLLEVLGGDMGDGREEIFKQMMNRPEGYLYLSILAPITEEMVFRGAILRKLLTLFDRRLHWIPIVISALLFGALHGNLPQFVHGTLIGLLLGWMYYRTDSIVPGIVMHWVNNTVAYVIVNTLPAWTDAKLIDIFKGSQTSVWLALLMSMLIFLPSLYQLTIRLKRKNA